MNRRTLRRSIAAAMTALLLTTVAAYADTVPADGDAVTPGNQALIVLPDASPGQVVTWPVTFKLTCTGLNHAAPDATIDLALLSASVPLDGHASATPTSIGPVPATWTPSGEGCPSPAPTVASSAPSVVTLTMPTTAADSYLFTLMWSRAGTSGLSGSSAITFQVNVVGNTPPTLHLPVDVSAEATSPSGAAVSWTATAEDAEDTVPPTPTCDRTSGSTFALGLTTVHCSVTDGGGLSASGSFVVSVADTGLPQLVGMPGDRSLTTADPTGTTLTYTPPTATDLADAAPAVDCAPASGSHIPVGSTTVTCTARDATGNHVSSSFRVNVTYVAPVAWSAVWGEPVASTGSTFAANAGRTLPVKVRLFADGAEQTQGRATLSIATCGGTPAGWMPLSWGGGRWNGSLDTSMLGGAGCYVVTASFDGNAAGSFRLDLRGAEPTANSGGPKAKTKP